MFSVGTDVSVLNTDVCSLSTDMRAEVQLSDLGTDMSGLDFFIGNTQICQNFIGKLVPTPESLISYSWQIKKINKQKKKRLLLY